MEKKHTDDSVWTFDQKLSIIETSYFMFSLKKPIYKCIFCHLPPFASSIKNNSFYPVFIYR